jgi:sterol desaturase/sphingolipid hydroxylase (fatty acid hydroxylase superfamily)
MTPVVLKWAFAMGLFGTIAGFGVLLNCVSYALAFGTGFSAAYGYYEYFHWSLHQYAASSSYGRWARRHHFYHHFHEPKMNHGVTSPIWDILFDTYRPVQEAVCVPRSLAMRWMSLDQRWPNDFSLRGGTLG